MLPAPASGVRYADAIARQYRIPARDPLLLERSRQFLHIVLTGDGVDLERVQSSLHNRRPDHVDDIHIIVQVMDGVETWPQHLLRYEEVAQISTRVVLASITATVGINGT